jgi:hypothetical protein
VKDFNEDDHLDVCQNIEVGLKIEYENNPDLTDLICINGLENAKVAIKKEFGFSKNEKVTSTEEVQGIINWCVSIGLERIGKVNDLTLKEYVARIDKVKKSVKRHSELGRRGYFEFIKKYV